MRRDGRGAHLSATEFRLLCEMAHRPGQVFTRELLLELVWGYEFLGDSRLVNIAVQRLRTKIERPRSADVDHDGSRSRVSLRRTVTSARSRPHGCDGDWPSLSWWRSASRPACSRWARM